MLLQYLRSAEPVVEAVIAFNLVDLALCIPKNVFIDIIRAFSAINRTANPDDPRLSNNMVCKCLEVLHLKEGSWFSARFLLRKLDWPSSSIGVPTCTKCTSSSF